MLYSTKELNKKTVKQMYDYAVGEELALLSNFNGTFWSDYITNHERFDKLFMKKFKTFQYFDQSGNEDETVGAVTLEFIENVYGFLLENEKRFNELYRIWVILDTDLPLGRNYDITEVMDKDTSRDIDTTKGQRVDSGSNTQGSRSDSNSFTKGQEINSVDNDVYGYNDSTGTPSSSSTETLGTRSDSGSFTKGQQIDSSSFTKGQQKDSLEESGTEDYTLHKYGVVYASPIDTVSKHERFWRSYKFYDLIFREICAEMLLVGREV